MSEAGTAVARFDFASGSWRGTHLILYASTLVHRGDTHLETVPLASVASMRVTFARDQRKLGWAVGWFFIALLFFLVAGPLQGFASREAAEIAADHGIARMLQGLLRMVAAIANLLPLAGFGALAGAIALGAFGWLGTTTLTLDLAGSERIFPVRGNDAKLIDFSEAIAEKLMSLKR